MKLVITPLIAALAAFTGLYMFTRNCSITQEEALSEAHRILKRKSRDNSIIESPVFNKADCSYKFNYGSGKYRTEYVYSKWGKVHWYDRAAHNDPAY